jgi:hypothetical protein
VPHTVFLDADVLAAPVTRSLVLIASQQDDPPFQVRWSKTVEDEADRHLRPAQRSVADIRTTFDRGTEVLVSADRLPPELSDTDPKDQHVAAAAYAAGIGVIVTRNVRHFGTQDLVALSLSAVDPDRFLAANLTNDLYRATLEDICSARTREPRTPVTLHAALGREHPRLFDTMKHLFLGVEPTSTGHHPPARCSAECDAWPAVENHAVCPPPPTACAQHVHHDRCTPTKHTTPIQTGTPWLISSPDQARQ